MSDRSIAQAAKPASPVLSPSPGGILQRQCACGQHAMGGECEGCKKKQMPLQRKSNGMGGPAVVPPIVDQRLRPGLGVNLSLVPTRQRRALIISDSSDPMEAEADRTADQVMSSRRLTATSSATFPSVQRQGVALGPEQGEQESPDDDEALTGEDPEADVGDESGRPKLVPGANTQAKEHRIQIPDGPGMPLKHGVQSFMESRFGQDFSNVRIHADAAAARSAEQLQAHAYTVGQDLYFSENRYNPDSSDGRRLLAHELTHVVQQIRGGHLGLQRALRGPRGPMDAPHGAGQHRKRSDKPHPKCATGDCNGRCAAPVETAIRHPSCGNETCGTGSASSSSNFIRHLDVDLTTQMVVAELGTAAKTTSTTSFLSSPRAGTTPPGLHRIGRKCGPCHTNMKAHGMGWFTGFKNDLEFGFHDSQKVAKGVQSLGCVRVAPCDKAKWIHDNTASGTTTVCVHSGEHCKPKATKSKHDAAGKAGSEPGETPSPSEKAPSTPGSPLVSDIEPAYLGNVGGPKAELA